MKEQRSLTRITQKLSWWWAPKKQELPYRLRRGERVNNSQNICTCLYIQDVRFPRRPSILCMHGIEMRRKEDPHERYVKRLWLLLCAARLALWYSVSTESSVVVMIKWGKDAVRKQAGSQEPEVWTSLELYKNACSCACLARQTRLGAIEVKLSTYEPRRVTYTQGYWHAE